MLRTAVQSRDSSLAKVIGPGDMVPDAPGSKLSYSRIRYITNDKALKGFNLFCDTSDPATEFADHLLNLCL